MGYNEKMATWPENVDQIIKTDHYFPFIREKDKDIDGLEWFTAGLWDTNEIMLIMYYKDNVIDAIKRKSVLDAPPMDERVWGIDGRDLDLSLAMAEEMYNKHKDMFVS